MRTSIATVCLAGTLEEKVTAIADAGFDGLEIFEPDLIADHRTPREAGKMIRDRGLTVNLFQPFRDLEGLYGEDRTRAFDRLERKFDLMGELGCDLMLVCSSAHPRVCGGIDRMATDIADAGERAARRGLRIGYEALAWGTHVDDHRDAWEIVRRADHPSAGLILDSFHTLGRGLDPETIRSIPGDRIFFVQLADAPRIDMDLLYWSRHFRSMPGEGDLDVAAFMRAVGATGYNGPVSLEVFNDLFRGGRAADVAADGHRSLIALMDDVRRMERPTGLAPPALPQRAAIEGVEFVEFTTGMGGAPDLRALLGTMGFRHVGDHRSKKIALWQQGDARIVLNADGGGLAASAYAVHGLSVCDVGLRVPGADAAVERAAALGAAPFEQPLDAGQLDIPAIQGIGGGIVHLIDPGADVDDVWTVEFDRREAPGGTLRVDHIAETTTYDRMLSWGAAYSGVFSLERTPMMDVSDPDGLVRSMALATSNRAFRLTVNGAETHRTLAGHFLADSFHSAVQHIAFATEDLFAFAERLRDLEFAPLPIPSNYYCDVAARFGLDSLFVERLRGAGLMFDRDDAGGDFLQLYSRPTEEGLFFEFVERRGGYDGYGAANAPFRIAAPEASDAAQRHAAEVSVVVGLPHHRMRCGMGSVVVMLHALGTDLSHWGDVLRQLPEDVPVLACDLAGHGASPRGAASVEAHADDVALPTEHHDLHEAIVCGVSLGGIVAQALAASRGGVVARMILICTGQRIGSAVIWQERRRAILSIGLPGTAPDIVERWG